MLLAHDWHHLHWPAAAAKHVLLDDVSRRALSCPLGVVDARTSSVVVKSSGSCHGLILLWSQHRSRNGGAWAQRDGTNWWCGFCG